MDQQIQDETFVGANKTNNEKNGDNTLLDFTTGPKPYQGCQSNVVQETENKIKYQFTMYFYVNVLSMEFYSPFQQITLAALVWLWTRCEIQKCVVSVLLIVGLVCSYKGLILDKQIQNETFFVANETNYEKNSDNTLLDFTTGPKPY